MASLPIAAKPPAQRLLGMAELGPLLETVDEVQVHAGKDFLRRTDSVVVCPTANDRIEGLDERGLGATSILASDVFDLLGVAFLRFPAGLDDGFEAGFVPECTGVIFPHPILPDMKTQKIEPNLPVALIERVDDAGLAGFQAQSHSHQPLFGGLLEFSQCCQVMVQYHQVVGVANDARNIALPVLCTLRDCLDQDLLEPMQGDIHQQGRDHPALRDASFWE